MFFFFLRITKAWSGLHPMPAVFAPMVPLDWKWLKEVKSCLGLCQLVPAGCHLEAVGWSEYSGLLLPRGKHQRARRLKVQGSCVPTCHQTGGAINWSPHAVFRVVLSCQGGQFHISGCFEGGFVSTIELCHRCHHCRFFHLLAYLCIQQMPNIRILQQEVVCCVLQVLVVWIWVWSKQNGRKWGSFLTLSDLNVDVWVALSYGSRTKSSQSDFFSVCFPLTSQEGLE